MADQQVSASPVQVFTGCPDPGIGAVSLTVNLDFVHLGQDINIDLQPIQQTGKMGSVQSIYIDNSANAQPMTITVDGTLQTLTIPPQSCGYYTLLATNPPRFKFHTTGVFVIRVQFLNYYVPGNVWSAVSVKGT